MTKKKSTSFAAFSLIEMMVAIAIISLILTGLALMMLYSNRTIQEARLRSSITDQAQSCLDNFRNLRDSNSWAFFCQRLNAKKVGGDSGSAYTGGDTLTFADDSGYPPIEICPALPNDSTYTFSFTDGPNFLASSNPCHNLQQQAKVAITINYTDINGTPRTLTLEQIFQKSDTEAPYSL